MGKPTYEVGKGIRGCIEMNRQVVLDDTRKVTLT
jgi:hypothetical protein